MPRLRLPTLGLRLFGARPSAQRWMLLAEKAQTLINEARHAIIADTGLSPEKHRAVSELLLGAESYLSTAFDRAESDSKGA